MVVLERPFVVVVVVDADVGVTMSEERRGVETTMLAGRGAITDGFEVVRECRFGFCVFQYNKRDLCVESITL